MHVRASALVLAPGREACAMSRTPAGTEGQP